MILRRRRQRHLLVKVGDQEKHWATAGDVVVLPYGDQHRMGGVGECEVVPLMSIMAPPWTRMPLIRLGRDGPQTVPGAGFLHSDDVLFDPALRVFSPAFVVRPEGTAGAEWVRANVDFALAQAEASPLGPDAMNTGSPRCSSSRCSASTSPLRRRSTVAGSRH